jgi:AcrR family transcriptional regulator
MKTLTIPHIPETVSMEELTQVGGPSRERADAARNREKVLEAASRLFAERGADVVSMDDVAAEAGVGKGTLFRRFGDRAGLAHALLDEHEREFQDHLLRGDPPLGPGAAPCERIKAFGAGRFELLDCHYALIAAAEAAPATRRFAHPVYAAHRAHLFILAREADPEVDPEYVADILLNSLTAEFFAYLRYGRELSVEEIQAGFNDLVDRLLAG